MPIINILGYNNVVISTTSYDHNCWRQISKTIYNEYKDDIIYNAAIIQEILLKSLTVIENEFKKKLQTHKKFSFYLFVQNFHENSCEIWLKCCSGFDLGELNASFAISRRTLKVILEQACEIDYENSPSFADDCFKNRFVYLETLE
ncbi:MAG: hypothetical protein ACK4GL_10675 [Flavobacteriales bacterium]